ncbi:MAG: histidine--tRNA ligase [Candidatus Omnitrophica bacterium]|nr:histidine--tRNA ligase [Candidatus Omnitrophota bacterium]
MFKKVSGTKDILPEEVIYWQEIEEISRKVFSLYNYKEIRPPAIEDAALFNRSLGEFTEIVQKQMFLIKNQEELYAMRPEGTASIVRAYIENSLDKTAAFQKLYYMGPMFRLERPQKGRLRQFHHIGCEVIGSGDPGIDVEIISLADKLLSLYGISGYEIKINSLGCLNDKKNLVKILNEELKNKLGQLCQECNERYKHNVLRILDCKNDSCQQALKNLGIHDKYLCSECAGHFNQVKSGLDALKVKYEVSPHLVRGLDYYTRTVFEIKHSGLGAQDAIGAGGRYDNLVKELGGPDAGAIGFAFGVERILLAAGNRPQAAGKKIIYIIPLGNQAKEEGLKLLNQLRDAGMPADTDYEGKSLKGAMRSANSQNAQFSVIIGENELKNNTIMLKDMETGDQIELPKNKLIEEIKKRC